MAEISGSSGLTIDQTQQLIASAMAGLPIPQPSTASPSSEATSPMPGTNPAKFAQEGHQHPRLTSTTYATVSSGSTANVNFTRTFTNKPGMVLTEIEGDVAVTSQPASFKPQSWILDSNGLYVGCVVKVWRAQAVPQNLTSLLVTAIYNIFGASVIGTQFSCIAVARSDVAH